MIMVESFMFLNLKGKFDRGGGMAAQPFGTMPRIEKKKAAK